MFTRIFAPKDRWLNNIDVGIRSVTGKLTDSAVFVWDIFIRKLSIFYSVLSFY